jgi:hypothetical protein
VDNLFYKHETNAQIGDGWSVGRLEECMHQPTTKKNKWEASEGFKASHGSKGKDDGKTRSMHDK